MKEILTMLENQAKKLSDEWIMNCALNERTKYKCAHINIIRELKGMLNSVWGWFKHTLEER